MLSIFINLLLVIHVIVSLLIVLVVLMQRPKSEGLGAAFGGGMTDNLFGAQTTNVLQGFTRWLGGLFFGLTLCLSVLYAKQSNSESAVQQRLKNAAVPAASPALGKTESTRTVATDAVAIPVATSPTPAPTASPAPSVPVAAPSAKPSPTAS